jgi:hypothetical protein
MWPFFIFTAIASRWLRFILTSSTVGQKAHPPRDEEDNDSCRNNREQRSLVTAGWLAGVVAFLGQATAAAMPFFFKPIAIVSPRPAETTTTVDPTEDPPPLDHPNVHPTDNSTIVHSMDNAIVHPMDNSTDNNRLDQPVVTCHICFHGVFIPANEERRLTPTCARDRTICVDCLQLHIEEQIIVRHVYVNIPCICTRDGCTAALSHNEIHRFANQATFDQYNEAICRLALESDPDYYKCANPKCSSGQIHPDLQRNQPMRCRACRFKTCVTHHCPWHKHRTCDEYDRDVRRQHRKLAKLAKHNNNKRSSCGVVHSNKNNNNTDGVVVAAVDILAPPDSWTTETKTELVQVPKATAEYNQVADFFANALHAQRHHVQIVEISRVQNLSLWQAYALKHHTVKLRDAHNLDAYRVNNRDRSSSNAHERRWLFHGAPPHVVPVIAKQGFNRTFARGVSYGRGVYFARDASYSIPYSQPHLSTNVRYMFMCRVVVGDWSKGSYNIKTPDPKPHNPLEMFDSTVDHLRHPSIFVTYQDAQAYPEYLVAFKCPATTSK